MNPIILVIGPSSVGKSTFIKQNLEGKYTIYMLNELLNQTLDICNLPDEKGIIIHYNSLYIYKNDVKNYQKEKSLITEFILKQLLERYPKRLVIYLLRTSKDVLLTRIKKRRQIEPYFRPSIKSEYPGENMGKLVEVMDMDYEYAKWCILFNKNDLHYDIIET